MSSTHTAPEIHAVEINSEDHRDGGDHMNLVVRMNYAKGLGNIIGMRISNVVMKQQVSVNPVYLYLNAPTFPLKTEKNGKRSQIMFMYYAGDTRLHEKARTFLFNREYKDHIESVHLQWRYADGTLIKDSDFATKSSAQWFAKIEFILGEHMDVTRNKRRQQFDMIIN